MLLLPILCASLITLLDIRVLTAGRPLMITTPIQRMIEPGRRAIFGVRPDVKGRHVFRGHRRALRQGPLIASYDRPADDDRQDRHCIHAPRRRQTPENTTDRIGQVVVPVAQVVDRLLAAQPDLAPQAAELRDQPRIVRQLTLLAVNRLMQCR